MKKQLHFKNTSAFLYLVALFLAKTLSAQVVQTFTFTGAAQSFTVPSCVSAVTVEVWGAQGGIGTPTTANYGGYAKGVFNFAVGDVLNIYAGGQPSTIAGGYNGGGSGDGLGFGGGGGSDVRLNGTNLTNRIIVAGGGGGGGFWNVTGESIIGGVGGGPVGGDGYRTNVSSPGGSGGGQTGLTNGFCGSAGDVASSGGLGVGGNIAVGACGCSSGYGGGGGYYGGGAGGNCRGGGGGSGYILASATNTAFSSGTNIGHGKVILSYNTNGSGVVASVASPLGICPGGNTNLDASGVVSYTWSTNSNAASINVSPGSTTSYTVQGTNSIGCISTAILTVTVNSIPTISVASSNASMCIGQTATLTAGGASTYTWNTGTGIMTGSIIAVAGPSVNSVYTVSALSAAGCAGTIMYNADVYPMLLSVTANTSICLGKPVTLTATGAVSYNWSNGSSFSGITLSPAASTVYAVTSVDANNCTATKTISVTVNPLPPVTATADHTLICKGSPVVLTGDGAATYLWSTGEATAAATITPAADVTYNYTVTGTDANGCSKTASVTVKVQLCTGINEQEIQLAGIMVFPNPNNGLFNVSIPNRSKAMSICVYNVTGHLVRTQPASENSAIDLQKEPAGVYFIEVMDNNKAVYKSKIIKQ